MPNDRKLTVKTFRGIDFVDISPADQVLFTPFSGKTFVPTRVLTRATRIGGTISTQPQFKITAGSGGTAIVAAAANMPTAVEKAKTLTVVTDQPATNGLPLVLTKTVAAAGTNPVFVGDVIVEGYVL